MLPASKEGKETHKKSYPGATLTGRPLARQGPPRVFIFRQFRLMWFCSGGFLV